MFRSALLLLLVFATGALACAPLDARPRVDIAVIDRDSGQWLPEYRHRGDAWIAGRPGHRYAVRLTNRSDRRVLVVLSVDGVNAVTGQTAHPSQAGYVLAPWQSTEIAGWRKSYQDVAQFVFTDLPDSYAARTGRPDNVGVIGIAVFDERTYAHYDDIYGPPIAERRKAASAPSAAASAGRAEAADAQAQALGTGHGEREWAPVSRTTFERASMRPVQVTQLRYDDEDALAARGVIPRGPWFPRHGQPDAFPSAFVPDP